MNNNIVTFVPKRDIFGRFKTTKWRKLAYKVIVYQLIALSVVFNAYFVRRIYVFRCSAGGGYFMTGDKCDELSKNQDAAIELGRQEILANNPDL